jgi:hypothetical protein
MIYRYTLSLLIVSLSLSAQPLEQKSCFKKAQKLELVMIKREALLQNAA